MLLRDNSQFRVYKINFMTQHLIYDLPKVKLRFKTAPSQSH